MSDLRQANMARQKEWDAGNQITLAYRGNELAGEVGEACNVIKKLERERMGIRGSRATVEQLAEELADVVICADLIATAEGIDLDAAVIAKFNATSEKVGLATRLAAAPQAADDARPEVVAWSLADTLAKQVEELTRERDMLWQSSRLLADAQERDEARADTATVQIAALREALRQIASRCNFVGTIGGDRGAQWAADLARAALAATEPEPTPRTDPYMAVFGVPSTTTEPAKPPSPQEPRYSAVTTAHKIATEKMTTLRGALSPRPAKEGERVRHVKRGSTYRVIGEAEVQCAVMVEEGDRLTVYRCDTDGKLWARPTAEFRDGRFEPAKESE